MRKISVEFSEILGLLCAEGCHSISFSSYWGLDRGKKRFYKNKKSEKIEFFNKDHILLLHYQNLLFEEFGYTPKITKYGKILICKKDIIRKIIFFTQLGHLKWRVPHSILDSEDIVKIRFLRGYFDGDGTIINRARFFSTNQAGLKQVSRLLIDLKIKHTIQKPVFKENRKPLYSIQISEKSKETFLNLLKPISKCPDKLRG